MADNILPGARVSPRLASGAICWYAGDTFTVQLLLELADQDGAAVTIGAADTVKVTFYDKQRRLVKEFSFTGPAGNTVSLVFDDGVTALFPKGEYTYDILYTYANKTTLARDNRARVE